MTNAQAQKVALFFFFYTQDEILTYELTLNACEIFQKKEKNQSSDQTHEQLLVDCTNRICSKNEKKLKKMHSLQQFSQYWLYPEGIDFSPWKEFIKKATPSELFLVIWSQILKISDKDLSLGLDLSEGTIRYRLSSALKKLGEVNQLGIKKFELLKGN